MRSNQELVPDHGFYTLYEKGKEEVGPLAVAYFQWFDENVVNGNKD